MAIDIFNSPAIIAVMKLDTYLTKFEISQSDFANSIGVTQGMVYQWINKDRPVTPIKCVEIEKQTKGHVTRKDLRPDDWKKIWPELAMKKAA